MIDIPSPDTLRAQRDARLAAEFAAALQGIVDDLKTSNLLRASRTVTSRALADALAEKLRSAGWIATISCENPRDGGGYVVAVSAPDAGASS